MNTFPQIVIGTYEEFVLGYNIKYEDEKEKKITLHQTFATHSHQASVRCVAAHKNLMATSGADEYINIYDMVAMEVSTVINYHTSTVTCLAFTPDGSHLVSANQNGDIAIFQCRDWTLVKLWKEAHKHACGVTSASVHPSGSLLLTTGADNILRFWNLVKGRQAYATNMAKKCSVGCSLNFATWSKDGNFYAVFIGNKVEIYKAETAGVVYEITTKSRITSSAFTKKNLICLGMENGSLEIHSVQRKHLLVAKEAHKIRIKSLDSFAVNLFKEPKNKLQNYVVSVDSRGGIKLWHLKKKQLNYSLVLKGETSCDCRITCLTMVGPVAVKQENQDSSDEIKMVDSVIDNFMNEKDHHEEVMKKKVKKNDCSTVHASVSKNSKNANEIKMTKGSALQKSVKKKRKNFEQHSENEKISKTFKKKRLTDSHNLKIG